MLRYQLKGKRFCSTTPCHTDDHIGIDHLPNLRLSGIPYGNPSPGSIQYLASTHNNCVDMELLLKVMPQLERRVLLTIDGELDDVATFRLRQQT